MFICSGSLCAVSLDCNGKEWLALGLDWVAVTEAEVKIFVGEGG